MRRCDYRALIILSWSTEEPSSTRLKRPRLEIHPLGLRAADRMASSNNALRPTNPPTDSPSIFLGRVRRSGHRPECVARCGRWPAGASVGLRLEPGPGMALLPGP